MRKLHERLFGVDEKGWPSLPNSRRQLLVGGIICLAVWPGIGLILLAFDQLPPGQEIFAVVSPFLIVTVLGAYLLGQSVFSRRERPRFTKHTTERKPRQ